MTRCQEKNLGQKKYLILLIIFTWNIAARKNMPKTAFPEVKLHV